MFKNYLLSAFKSFGRNKVFTINISWWVFGLCGISMLVIAIIVLGIRTISAAKANPVKSLRTE